MIKRSSRRTKRSSRRTLGAAAAVTLAIAACGDNLLDPGDDPLGPLPSDVEFDASLGIDLASMTETESGLFVLDVVPGTGEIAVAGDSRPAASRSTGRARTGGDRPERVAEHERCHQRDG